MEKVPAEKLFNLIKSRIFIKCMPVLFFLQSQFYRRTDLHATYKLAPSGHSSLCSESPSGARNNQRNRPALPGSIFYFKFYFIFFAQRSPVRFINFQFNLDLSEQRRRSSQLRPSNSRCKKVYPMGHGKHFSYLKIKNLCFKQINISI